MKEKMENGKETCIKDVNSVWNQTRAKVCRYVFYFENMKEKLKNRDWTVWELNNFGIEPFGN